jgi:hypothetical protein
VNAAQRKIRARMGGLATRAAGHVNVQPSHDAFLRRFEDQVDPDRILPHDERARRALAARKVHMGRLALRSSLSRSKRKATPEIQRPGMAEEARRDPGERPTPA